MNNVDIARATTKLLLDKWEYLDWSLQGFGMLRLYLPGDVRLNIWDNRFAVPNVSLMHTHPWHFESLVVTGRLRNVRFHSDPAGHLYSSALIKPGPGGGLLDHQVPVRLVEGPMEEYKAGDSYSQLAHEIHISYPENGTITLNQRVRVGDDVAHVYWPHGEEWVSAEPRRASRSEAESIVDYALNVFWGKCEEVVAEGPK